MMAVVGQWGHGFECSTGSVQVQAMLQKKWGITSHLVRLGPQETDNLFHQDTALAIDSAHSPQSPLIRVVPYFPTIDTRTAPGKKFESDRVFDPEKMIMVLKKGSLYVLGYQKKSGRYINSGVGISHETLEEYFAQKSGGACTYPSLSKNNGPLLMYFSNEFPEKPHKRQNNTNRASTLIPTYFDPQGNLHLAEPMGITSSWKGKNRFSQMSEAYQYLPLLEDDLSYIQVFAERYAEAERKTMNNQYIADDMFALAEVIRLIGQG